MWTISKPMIWSSKKISGDAEHEIVLQFGHLVRHFQFLQFQIVQHFHVLHFHAPGFRWSVTTTVTYKKTEFIKKINYAAADE